MHDLYSREDEGCEALPERPTKACVLLPDTTVAEVPTNGTKAIVRNRSLMFVGDSVAEAPVPRRRSRWPLIWSL
jgi:hypothetical protein